MKYSMEDNKFKNRLVPDFCTLLYAIKFTDQNILHFPFPLFVQDAANINRVSGIDQAPIFAEYLEICY